MFDWPLHSQTSPIKTSLISIVFVPSIRRVRGSVCANIAGKVTRHVPLLVPVVVASLPPSVTRISSPGSHQPHTGISLSCCRTMWSPKKPGSLTAAWQSACVQRHAASVVLNSVVVKKWFIFFFSLTICAAVPCRDRMLVSIGCSFERVDRLSICVNRL